MKKLFGYLAGAVAVLALLITNVGTLHEAWCKNIGTFCSPPPESIDWAKSDVVYVSSGGTKDKSDDECKCSPRPCLCSAERPK